MKTIHHIAVAALICSLPALCLAQTVTLPAEKPAGQKAAPMKAESKDGKMAPKPVYRPLTAKSREDARECLSFPTNQEIIICAEKYL